jgi:tricorn protease-like protein
MTDTYKHLDSTTVAKIAEKARFGTRQGLTKSQVISAHTCDLIGAYGFSPGEITQIDTEVARIIALHRIGIATS